MSRVSRQPRQVRAARRASEQAHRSRLSVSRRVTVVACESAHNWIGALERGL